MNAEIRLLSTGGTIDKEYSEESARLEVGQPAAPRILTQGRCSLKVAITPLMAVDSLAISAQQRGLICDAVMSASERWIIVTHGTDTIVETAREIARRASNHKTVILTGAMRPVSTIGSDGDFNIGFALAAVQLLRTGVFVAMNGRVFQWDAVTKTDLGFVSLTDVPSEGSLNQ